EGTISINYTSGTTGRPKGVMYHHRGAHLNSYGEIVHSFHTPDSVYLWTLPMFHCNGWCTPWAVTAIAGTHVCLREVRGDVIWSLIREHGVTHLNGAPTVVTTILRDKAAAALETQIVITTAGAPPSPTTIKAAEDMGFRIVHVYGLTETYGPYSVNAYRTEDLRGDDRSAKQARQGVGMICADRMRVVDKDMNDVPRDGATLGEVEQAVVSHPAVLEAAVIGVPDEQWGERPKAFVVLSEGENATPDELIEHVKTKIARYKAPRDVEIVEALPKTSTGKVQKFELREKEWGGETSRVRG